jgi:DNA-binding MarR family transcriptional regulator
MKQKARTKTEIKNLEVDFSPVHHEALIKLRETAGASQQVLAKAMNRNKAQIARIVASLQSQNLIDKQADAKDRRSVKLAITPQGQKLLTRLDAVHLELTNQMFSTFSAEEVEVLDALLCRAIKSVE